MNKWYMHNPEYILENETHKILWDFEIQTDQPISARRSDLMIVNNNKKKKKKKKGKKRKEKRISRTVDFAVLAD